MNQAEELQEILNELHILARFSEDTIESLVNLETRVRRLDAQIGLLKEEISKQIVQKVSKMQETTKEV